MRKQLSSALPIFLLGLFSQTQIRFIAFMDISELICYIIGPYYLIQDWAMLKRHGFGTFIFVWILATIGCCISTWYNNTSFPCFLRGAGTTIAVLCITATFHHFLMRDFKAFKWFFLGWVLSGVLSVYVFQRGASRSVGGEIVEGAEATKQVVGYSLFWMAQLSAWLTLPIQMRYLKLPKWYSIGVALFIILFGFFSAGSRSGMGVLMFTLVLVLIGGKTRQSLMFARRHFMLIFFIMASIVPFAAMVYKYCATHNYLGEKAYEKYVNQTKRGSDILSILMAGRAETFVGLFACLDKPIVGHGPWAIDAENRYYLTFLQNYGDEEDFAKAKKSYEYFLPLGKVYLIPAHSFVISFWLWYGVLGLICMLYVFWVYFRTLKNYLGTIPELYGTFVFFLPSVLWAWMFSPFGGRTQATFMMVLCLFAHAVATGKFYYERAITNNLPGGVR